MFTKVQVAILRGCLELASKRGLESDFTEYLDKAGVEDFDFGYLQDEIDALAARLSKSNCVWSDSDIEVFLVLGLNGLYLDIAHPGQPTVASIELAIDMCEPSKTLAVFAHEHGEGCESGGDLIHTITEDWTNYHGNRPLKRYKHTFTYRFEYRSNTKPEGALHELEALYKGAFDYMSHLLWIKDDNKLGHKDPRFELRETVLTTDIMISDYGLDKYTHYFAYCFEYLSHMSGDDPGEQARLEDEGYEYMRSLLSMSERHKLSGSEDPAFELSNTEPA